MEVIIANANAGLSVVLNSILRNTEWMRNGDAAERFFQKLLNSLPEIEKTVLKQTWYILDVLLSPKQIVRQLGLIFAIQSTLMLTNSIGALTNYIWQRVSKKGQKIRSINEQMSKARSYAEWRCLAEEEDRINGYHVWRNTDESSLYDARILRQRINDLNSMIRHGKVFDMMFRLRGGISRDQYGMQHEGLYTRAKGGTKRIVETYHQTVVNALNMVCDCTDADEAIPIEAKLAFFNETRHAYGRTALMLSGGAALGFYHIGLAKALWNEGLLPKVISGASAGSLIAAVLGTRRDDEMLDILENCRIRLDFFKFGHHGPTRDGTNSLSMRFLYSLPQSFRWLGDAILGGIYNRESMLKMGTDHLKEVIIHNVGYYTFQEAFDRTGRIINITVAPLNNYDPPRLLNYLTAPHVCVWSAAAASCAIPGVFDSIQLFVKEPNGEYRPEHVWTMQGKSSSLDIKSGSDGSNPDLYDAKMRAQHASYTDGSIENDLPMQQLSELFNVNHFIVSQVNPHSSILSSLAVRANVWSPPIFGLVVGYLRFLKAQFRDWLNNLIDLVSFRSLAPSWNARRGLIQLITQEYEGRPIDVTIQPWINHLNPIVALMHVIVNVTEEQFFEIVRIGENNSYPFICRIREQCMVERTLDLCIHRIRNQIMLRDSRLASTFGVDSVSTITSVGDFNEDIPAVDEFGAPLNHQPVVDRVPIGGGSGDAVVIHAPAAVKSGFDRTPSFYSTRNMHEYTVSDPMVIRHDAGEGRGLGQGQNTYNSSPTRRHGKGSASVRQSVRQLREQQEREREELRRPFSPLANRSAAPGASAGASSSLYADNDSDGFGTSVAANYTMPLNDCGGGSIFESVDENSGDSTERKPSPDDAMHREESRGQVRRQSDTKDSPFNEFGNSSDDLTNTVRHVRSSSGRSVQYGAASAADADEVTGYEQYGSARGMVRNISGNSNMGLPLSRSGSRGAVEEGGDGRGHSDAGAGMPRTPSMADFYYHRSSRSTDQLQQMDAEQLAEFNNKVFNIDSKSNSRNSSRNDLQQLHEGKRGNRK